MYNLLITYYIIVISYKYIDIFYLYIHVPGLFETTNQIVNISVSNMEVDESWLFNFRCAYVLTTFRWPIPNLKPTQTVPVCPIIPKDAWFIPLTMANWRELHPFCRWNPHQSTSIHHFCLLFHGFPHVFVDFPMGKLQFWLVKQPRGCSRRSKPTTWQWNGGRDGEWLVVQWLGASELFETTCKWYTYVYYHIILLLLLYIYIYKYHIIYILLYHCNSNRDNNRKNTSSGVSLSLSIYIYTHNIVTMMYICILIMIVYMIYVWIFVQRRYINI